MVGGRRFAKRVVFSTHGRAYSAHRLSKRQFQALGIASFGPVDLHEESPTYGYITTTPKPGWKELDILGFFRHRFNVPMGFETDVNAPAMAEAMYGQHG